MDLLQSLLALMTPIGLALFALLITREGQKDRAAENERRDKREEEDRNQRAKESQQFMLLLATITGKQVEGTTAVTAAVTSAKTDVTAAIEKSGAEVIASVEASEETILEAITLVPKAMIALFRPVSSEPPNIPVMIAILKQTIKDAEAAQKRTEDEAAAARGEQPPTDAGESSEERSIAA